MRTTIPNFNLFSKIKLYKKFFYIKTFSRQCQVFHFRTYSMNWNHCRVFETKPNFPFWSLIRNSKQNSFSYLTKQITESKNYFMKTKLTTEL